MEKIKIIAQVRAHGDREVILNSGDAQLISMISLHFTKQEDAHNFYFKGPKKLLIVTIEETDVSYEDFIRDGRTDRKSDSEDLEHDRS